MENGTSTQRLRNARKSNKQTPAQITSSRRNLDGGRREEKPNAWDEKRAFLGVLSKRVPPIF